MSAITPFDSLDATRLLHDRRAAALYCNQRVQDWRDLKEQLIFVVVGPHTLQCEAYGDVLIRLYLSSGNMVGDVYTKSDHLPRHVLIETLDQAFAYILARFW